jgi:hypothetical protein
MTRYRRIDSQLCLRNNESIITFTYQPANITPGKVRIAAPPVFDSDFGITATSMVTTMHGGSNYGFLWMVQNEATAYRSVNTASSDRVSPYEDHRPKLTITYTPMKKLFYLKDHLGNIRVTVDKDGVVKGYDDYYPLAYKCRGDAAILPIPTICINLAGRN